jgi:hypothetical protein
MREEYDSKYPIFCVYEKSVVLHADVLPPITVGPAQPERADYEYECKGTRNLFVMVEPLVSRRHMEVTEHHNM